MCALVIISTICNLKGIRNIVARHYIVAFVYVETYVTLIYILYFGYL